ncbi:9813_t:CDS:2 [Ambispora leptoticha]|uniref:9813_t:CDS:1 n=1 Tax=Ambispora leptoticha TaxID=144679 RepID=A0A9N9FDY0_9GLOM|nr:9813_t:CDS:2 [Ambispora leptoticha]
MSNNQGKIQKKNINNHGVNEQNGTGRSDRENEQLQSSRENKSGHEYKKDPDPNKFPIAAQSAEISAEVKHLMEENSELRQFNQKIKGDFNEFRKTCERTINDKIQTINDQNQTINEQNQTINDHLQTINYQRSEFSKAYQALQNDHNGLKALYTKEDKEWKKEKKAFNQEISELQQKNNDLESMIERFNEAYKKLAIELNNKDTSYQTQNRNWEIERLKNKETTENLQNEVISLKAEAAQFQSALGNARNVRWDDEDVNNSVNLNKDIKALQNSLREFTQLKGKAYIVKESGVKQLFNKYNSKANIEHKPSISAALQRLTIETILNDYAKYINTRSSTKSNAEDNSLERQLLIYNETITKIIENFAETRAKNDEMVRITGIKIRQAVYAMLGNSGFGKKNHKFVADTKYNLLDTLMNYRTIVTHEKRKEQDERAGDITLSVTRIFKFRLLAQEPIATFRWFENGDQLNETLMEWVSNGEDDSDMVVDICAFPAIGVNLDDPNKWQIYMRAKVVICNKSEVSQEKNEGLLGKLISYSSAVKKSIF